jgi:hypothetical protein
MVTVRDSGIVLDPATQAQIFIAFHPTKPKWTRGAARDFLRNTRRVGNDKGRVGPKSSVKKVRRDVRLDIIDE